jgi:hypothetical protein
MKKYFLIGITGLINLASIFAQNQIIHLKDGSIIKGNILNQNDSLLIIQTKYSEIKILKSDLKSVEYQSELNDIENKIQENDTKTGEAIKSTFGYFFKKKSPYLAASLSCLLPGLGQYYVGPYGSGFTRSTNIRGVLYTLSYGFGIVLVLINSGEETGDQEDALAICGAVSLLSFIDSIFSVNGYNNDLSMKFKLGFNHSNNINKISISYNF